MRAEPVVIAVARSVFDADALRTWAVERYALTGPVRCRFLRAGMNDTYLLEDAARRSVLRVYREGWRSNDAIAGEVGFLHRLAAAGIAVAAPLADRDGQEIAALAAPEGTRFAVRFSYADGALPCADTENSRLLGQALADLHTAADRLSLAGLRPALDLGVLLHQPLATLLHALANRVDAVAFLDSFAAWLGAAVRERAPLLDRGPLHGDPHEGNARIDAGGRVTWFDFDLCGDGWRAYDLAVYRMTMRVRGGTEGWAAFLNGYQQRRRLAPADETAVPIFVAIRDIWQLAYHLGNAQGGGEWWLDDAYIERRLLLMRDWAREQFNWTL